MNSPTSTNVLEERATRDIHKEEIFLHLERASIQRERITRRAKAKEDSKATRH
jgi:hypothetical protein